MTDEGNTMPADPSERRPRLTIVANENSQTVPLPAGGSLQLGRSRLADITIDHGSLSRIHGQFDHAQALTYTDLGSSNGSWLGGRLLEPNVPAELRDGDVLELGNVVVVIHQPGAHPTASTNPMDALRDRAKKAAKHRLNVLILGETGVGKGVLAREIHGWSPRAQGPFVVVDCASLAFDVIESELFGHEAGAFTGATAAKPGLLESASGGTVFLDEIGELPSAVQAKLLRALEDRVVRRVGGVADVALDVRFIAATHRDLERDALEGSFRSDLLYRLNAVTLRIPPLRARTNEIEPLARAFLRDVGGAELEAALTTDAARWLARQPWPGNARQLRNAVERAVATMEGDRLDVVAFSEAGNDTAVAPAADDERARILAALEACAGNQTKAAARLGISRRTLIHRLDLYGLPRPRKRTRS
ncbi:MAG: sigma 54-interacting transcriptional regulator [Myxococcota bacterium]